MEHPASRGRGLAAALSFFPRLVFVFYPIFVVRSIVEIFGDFLVEHWNRGSAKRACSYDFSRECDQQQRFRRTVVFCLRRYLAVQTWPLLVAAEMRYHEPGQAGGLAGGRYRPRAERAFRGGSR